MEKDTRFQRKYSTFYGINPLDGRGYHYIRERSAGSWSWVTKESDHLHCLLFPNEEQALSWIAEHGILLE